MSNRTQQSGVARAGDGNQSSDEERQGKADGNKAKHQCGLGSVRPSGLGTDHSGETRDFLTSALPSWSTQHNPVCEHLHCLNFIPWWCLLIGQAWLTASGLQSDRQEQAGPQPRTHSGRQRSDLRLGCGAQTCRCLQQGLGLAWGWEGLGRG